MMTTTYREELSRSSTHGEVIGENMDIFGYPIALLIPLNLFTTNQ
jgi:hypothetical protein